MALAGDKSSPAVGVSTAKHQSRRDLTAEEECVRSHALNACSGRRRPSAFVASQLFLMRSSTSRSASSQSSVSNPGAKLRFSAL